MMIQNQIAVVTGATGGIGRAITTMLAERGAAAVAVVDLAENCHTVAEDINRAVDRDVAVGFDGDVSDSAFRKHVFSEMKSRFGTVTVCVPAAGILRDALAVKFDRERGIAQMYDEDVFRQVLDVNLIHPVYWSIETIAGIVEERAQSDRGRWNPDEPISGSIVMIGSVSSRGNRGQISYSSAKSALNGACKTLNLEGMYHGVQCKIVHPGMVNTPMVEQMPDGYFEEHIKHQIPLGRMIDPSEIASAVAALIENPIISGALWADGAMMPMS
ncbi:MAG: SDR family NAD(P)-dependent oxidoreductase [Pseudomonadota bacterium]